MWWSKKVKKESNRFLPLGEDFISMKKLIIKDKVDELKLYPTLPDYIDTYVKIYGGEYNYPLYLFYYCFKYSSYKCAEFLYNYYKLEDLVDLKHDSYIENSVRDSIFIKQLHRIKK